MRRRLIVMRHAKSSWKEQGQIDHERPLKKRGRRDAPRVGARLAELGWAPERVLSSDSTRTRETWSHMEEALEGPAPQVEYLRSLYLAGVEAVRQEVARLPDEVATVLLLGHNPGWEECVTWFSGEETALTTANAALIEREAPTWAAAVAAPGGWRLDRVIRPKELPEG